MLDDDFGDERLILTDDLDSFVRHEDRHRSLTVVRELGERDVIAETRRWLDQLRRDAGTIEPCATMQYTANKWANGSRDGQLRGCLAVVRLDERGHRGLTAALDDLWSVRATDDRDFRKLVEWARGRVLTDPSPADKIGCRCDLTIVPAHRAVVP